MRYLAFIFRFTLITLFLSAAASGLSAQNPVTQAEKWAKEAKDQQAKAEAAAKKIDCEKPKARDKKALVDAVNKARDAARNAQSWADQAKESAQNASDAAKKHPNNQSAQAAKEKAEQTATDAQAAADEAKASAKSATDLAPGMAAAAALEEKLDKTDVSGNSKKKEVVDRLKKAAKTAAEENPCDPEKVKEAVRDELDKIKKEVARNGEMRPWVDTLGDQLKNDALISLPLTGTDALVYTAKGTGRTTGHIADLTVFNPTDQAATVAMSACYIPSSGQYQPYIVPSVPPVVVAPHTTANIPLNGYCADIFRAPVPAGASLPPLSTWVTVYDATPASALSNSDLPPDEINPPCTPVSLPGADWLPSPANGWKPSSAGAGDIVLTIPGTETPLGHTINLDKHPSEAAPLLLDAIRRIADAYDRLHQSGDFTTPFSGNPDKERESVIQQSFWMYAAQMTGKPYKVDDFRDNTIRQYEQTTGQPFAKAPDQQKQQIEQGVQDFWNGFQAVGVEAKILKAG